MSRSTFGAVYNEPAAQTSAVTIHHKPISWQGCIGPPPRIILEWLLTNSPGESMCVLNQGALEYKLSVGFLIAELSDCRHCASALRLHPRYVNQQGDAYFEHSRSKPLSLPLPLVLLPKYHSCKMCIYFSIWGYTDMLESMHILQVLLPGRLCRLLLYEESC